MSFETMTDEELNKDWALAFRYASALENEKERRAEVDRAARGLSARAHQVWIHTQYGDTTRECYCTAAVPDGHDENESPWITSSGERA
jgi:hypothetical protein